MRLTDDALSTSLYVLGGSGVGKTSAMVGWACQLIERGQGVGYIDPHGDAYNDLLARIAMMGKRVFDRVALFNPLDNTYTAGLNPLQLGPGEVAERRAAFLSTVITKIFHADPLVTARMQRMMFHAFWLLICVGLTLIEFVPLLTEKDFRARLLSKLSPTHKLRRYFEHEFPDQDRLITEWTQSSLNKVGELITDPAFELILGQSKSTIDFPIILDKQKVFLAHLPKGELGEKNSQIMGAFTLAQIQLAALSRARNPRSKRPRFTLFIDEFQNFATDDIHEILAESRKYQLALVMGHQFYEQLRDQPKLQAAVRNTVGSLICFRLGESDARQFVRDIFQPPITGDTAIKDMHIRYQKVAGMDWRFEDKVYFSLEELYERETRRLVTLEKREFWYKRRGPEPARKLRTLSLPDVKHTPKLDAAIAELVATSAAIYGRSKADASAEIAARMVNGPGEGEKPDLKPDDDQLDYDQFFEK